MAYKMRQVRRFPRSWRLREIWELNCVVERGRKVNGAQMMGYLFRRFGYPERGWDGYKELCCYYLSTPRRDLVLEVSIKACRAAELNLRFLAPHAVCEEASGDAAFARWREGLVPWFEENRAYPDFIEEFIRCIYVRLLNYTPEEAACQPVTPEDRRVALFQYGEMYSADNDKIPEVCRRAGTFYDEVWAAYKAAFPPPARPRRRKAWRTWPQDDMLRPYAEAGERALAEFEVPVRVRDGAVGAYGVVDTNTYLGRLAKEPKSAGYAPFGRLVNDYPDQVVKLVKALYALDPDAEAALARATSILEESAPPKRTGKGKEAS